MTWVSERDHKAIDHYAVALGISREEAEHRLRNEDDIAASVRRVIEDIEGAKDDG